MEQYEAGIDTKQNAFVYGGIIILVLFYGFAIVAYFTFWRQVPKDPSEYVSFSK